MTPEESWRSIITIAEMYTGGAGTEESAATYRHGIFWAAAELDRRAAENAKLRTALARLLELVERATEVIYREPDDAFALSNAITEANATLDLPPPPADGKESEPCDEEPAP
jgi:hypothetical protein